MTVAYSPGLRDWATFPPRCVYDKAIPGRLQEMCELQPLVIGHLKTIAGTLESIAVPISFASHQMWTKIRIAEIDGDPKQEFQG